MQVRFYHTEDRSEARTIITSVLVKANPVHWDLTIWNRGGCAGSLTVNAEDGPAVLDRLLPPAQRSETPGAGQSGRAHDGGEGMMDWLLILILLAWVAWGLYGLITNARTGSVHWQDWPELEPQDGPTLKRAAEKWAARERRKAVGR